MLLVESATTPAQDASAVRRADSGSAQAHFRSTSELVVMTVTVQQTSGAYVSTLGRDNFSIREEGVPQPIALFTSDDIPVDVALVLDTSASVADDIPLACQAALTLARGLKPADRVAVFTFSDRARLDQSFTDNRIDVERALSRVHSASTTAYYDAMNVVLQSFATSATTDDARRRAIVVLSDGEDTSSLSSFEDVLERARRLNVAVYTISLKAGPAANRSAVARQTTESAFEMRDLPFETGGRAFTLTKRDDLRGAYQSIADELGHQYSIAFVPQARVSGRFTRVRVDVNEPGLQVRTRTGYISDGSPATR
ncbi:MAG: VWA domain-containing protein [Vicinamibacterales bacterium]